MLIPHSFAVQPGQGAKIQRALRNSKGCNIKVKKGASLTGKLLVSPTHIDKYKKASHGSVVNLPFRHQDLQKNHRGGFLPLLAAALAPVIGGVAGGLIEKEIAGSGIKQQKPKHRSRTKMMNKLYTVEKHGSGMFLNPWPARHHR